MPSVLNEKSLLTQFKNMFLVNIFYAFQDRETLYLVMEHMPGGDLRYHICKRKRFNEDETRFFIACIFLGLEYLHSQNIIHRDIKPENLVLDSKGTTFFIKATYASRILVSLKSIGRRTREIQVARLAIWLQKLCAGRTIRLW